MSLFLVGILMQMRLLSRFRVNLETLMAMALLLLRCVYLRDPRKWRLLGTLPTVCGLSGGRKGGVSACEVLCAVVFG